MLHTVGPLVCADQRVSKLLQLLLNLALAHLFVLSHELVDVECGLVHFPIAVRLPDGSEQLGELSDVLRHDNVKMALCVPAASVASLGPVHSSQNLGAHLRLFELHEPEPRQSEPTPQPHIEFIRRLVFKEGIVLAPIGPHPALLVILPIVHHPVPPRLLLPSLQPPDPLPNNAHDLLVVPLEEEKVGEHLEVAVAVRVQEVDRLGRDERADGAVVGEGREEQDGRARVLLRVGEERGELTEDARVVRERSQEGAEGFDRLRARVAMSAMACAF